MVLRMRPRNRPRPQPATLRRDTPTARAARTIRQRQNVAGHAGVLPALTAGALPGSRRWTVMTARPGTDPFAELER
jgi:hypothetical protein